MKHYTLYFAVILSFFLILTPSAKASSPENRSEQNHILEKVTQDEFVNLPLDLTVEQNQEHTEKRFDRTAQNASEPNMLRLQRGFIADFDANVGIIKEHTTQQHMHTRSAALPRGRYFRPLNSKLGAAISKKF
ncbi:hypothetical protein [Hellea balneolensis]|uniref:hypothetical protein n=1 Tax=Hellea balneolensis TaxID=287478 RepID=UPI0004791E15|nr:hypothetical protein [Hellea balneolensis]